MNRAVETNLAMIRRVAFRLGPLRKRVVFLGGAATALLITDSAAPDGRITMDVDVIVEIAQLPGPRKCSSFTLIPTLFPAPRE